MSLRPWYYFLSIEKDFVATIDFVHLADCNSSAFSNEYAKLLLLIGSEVDVVAKQLCAKIDPKKTVGNIDDYREVITGKFKGMDAIEIEIPKFEMKRIPWSTWHSSLKRSPPWWTAYNSVKHSRDQQFSQANQGNVLNALCGLLALLLYYYNDRDHLQPYPDLLNYGFPDYLVTSGSRKLPGA